MSDRHADNGAALSAADREPLPLPHGASAPIHHTNGFNPPRPILPAARRGWRGQCPCCGEGRIFHRWMEARDQCPSCGEELHHARISNAVPAVAVPLAFLAAAMLGGVAEMLGEVPLLLEVVTCQLAGIAASLVVLPRAKGLLIALAWAHHVGGFDPQRHLLPDAVGAGQEA